MLKLKQLLLQNLIKKTKNFDQNKLLLKRKNKTKIMLMFNR